MSEFVADSGEFLVRCVGDLCVGTNGYSTHDAHTLPNRPDLQAAGISLGRTANRESPDAYGWRFGGVRVRDLQLGPSAA